MMCVYCSEEGMFTVDDQPESVACFEHLGIVVEDRMQLDETATVQVERCP